MHYIGQSGVVVRNKTSYVIIYPRTSQASYESDQ